MKKWADFLTCKWCNSLSLQIIEDVPDVDAVIVPVGGAGLIAGVACAIKTLKPECKVGLIVTLQCCDPLIVASKRFMLSSGHWGRTRVLCILYCSLTSW